MTNRYAHTIMFLIFNRTAGFVNYLFAFLILMFYSCGFDIETRPKNTIEPSEHFKIRLDPDLRFGFNHLETHTILENKNPDKIEVNNIGIIISDSSGWQRMIKLNAFEGNGEYIFYTRDLDPNKNYIITVYAELYSFFFKEPNNRIIYSDTLSFRTDPPPGNDQFIDIDGNKYPVVQIGKQYWFARDLRSRRFSTGEPLDSIIGNSPNCPRKSALGPAPDKGLSFESARRKMYNYYAAEDERNICPDGWKVPTVADVQQLSEFLGGWENAGAQLKSIHGWASPNENANNSTGFSALPYLERAGCTMFLNTYSPFTSFYLNHSYSKFWVLPDDTIKKDSIYSMLLKNGSDSLIIEARPAIESIPFYNGHNKNKMNCVRCIKK